MKKVVIFSILFFLLLLLFLHIYSKNKKEHDISKSTPEKILGSGYQLIPSLNNDDTLLVKTGFVIAFNKKYKIPDWAAYFLTKNEVLASNAERANGFKPEKCVQTATDLDFKKSGYDKGHIVPAKDMGYTQKCMEESFYYSNVCPQEPNFNRGRWKQLEEKVRQWAIENDSVFIVTGVFSRSINKTIGLNKIPVPEYFYKAIIDVSRPDYKAIAFLFENEKTSIPLEQFAITIDSLESFTHIDFFPELPNEFENQLESSFDFNKWGLH